MLHGDDLGCHEVHGQHHHPPLPGPARRPGLPRHPTIINPFHQASVRTAFSPLWESSTCFSLVRRTSGWSFQHDGAPPHRARSTTSWLRSRRVRRFNSGGHPPSDSGSDSDLDLDSDLDSALHGAPFTSTSFRLFPTLRSALTSKLAGSARR